MSTPQDTGPQAAPPQDKRMQRLLSYSTKNMIYSLVAVFALAFGVWALMPGDRGVTARDTNVTSVASYAVEQVDWPVHVPVDLGEDWQVTTVLFQEIAGQQTWRLGVATPTDGYLALSTTDDAGEAWLDMTTGETGELGELVLDGPDGEQTWQHRAGNALTSLVLAPEGDRTSTTVVHGTASDAELVEFVEHLGEFGD